MFVSLLVNLLVSYTFLTYMSAGTLPPRHKMFFMKFEEKSHTKSLWKKINSHFFLVLKFEILNHGKYFSLFFFLTCHMTIDRLDITFYTFV